LFDERGILRWEPNVMSVYDSASALVFKLTALPVPHGFDVKEQRFAARLGATTSDVARERLEAAGDWVSVRDAAWVLGCSKSTIQKYVEQKFLRSRSTRGKRRGKRRLRIPSDCVKDFIQLCEKWQYYKRFSFGRQRGGRKRLGLFTTKALWKDLRMAPGKLTVADAAQLLGCSSATIRRMIYSRELCAIRRTPCRWLVLKTSFSRFVPRTPHRQKNRQKKS
jgi:excisionase family DNA binding protein